ncbi:MAG TPA: dihydropteroate synthase [Mycobacteriales bacterium]|jgi:dihydropteroate synthase
MGVLNVTPDSFSDGGAYYDADAAVAHGLALAADGADVVDVGGESTRPGAAPVGADEEQRRVLPVVRALVAARVTVSIDTTHPAVAEAALADGASIVNDVSGGAVPGLLKVASAAGAPYVLMHARGPAGAPAAYRDVVAEVRDELLAGLDRAREAGVEEVVLDPGLGFAKDAGHNLALLRALPSLVALGHPVLVGASRKSFLGHVLGGRDVRDRDDATQATTALAAWHGAWGVRVHAVRPAADAVRVVAAVRGC